MEHDQYFLFWIIEIFHHHLPIAFTLYFILLVICIWVGIWLIGNRCVAWHFKLNNKSVKLIKYKIYKIMHAGHGYG